MDKGYLLHEGKTKRVYTLEDTESDDGFDSKEHLLVEFKNSISAFDGARVDEISEKGVLNNKISSKIYTFLEEQNVPTHFVKKLSSKEMLVKRVDIIPLEVVIRNIVSGSLIKRLGFKEGTILKYPVVELYYKNDSLSDPMINEYHIKNLEMATAGEVKSVTQKALEINELLVPYFKEKDLLLVDYKLEFGRDCDENIILADEISPDSCRLWDRETHKILDKDRFRKDMGEVLEGYSEIWQRISGGE